MNYLAQLREAMELGKELLQAIKELTSELKAHRASNTTSTS